MDDQRDYAEEAANRALAYEGPVSGKMDNSGHKMDYREIAQVAADFYTTVAHHPLASICASDTDIYIGAKEALLGAIRLAYPNYNESDIFDILVDCGESVSYCADYVRQNGQISLIRH